MMRKMHKRRQFVGAMLGLGVGTTVFLSGCGFELRQAPDFKFQRLWMNGPPQLLHYVRKYLRRLGDIEIVDDPLKAQVLLEILREEQVEATVGQTPSGGVREKQLRLKVVFRLWVLGQDADETVTVLEQYRESSYSEGKALAKDEEEALLFDDMRMNIAEQLVWRLASMQP